LRVAPRSAPVLSDGDPKIAKIRQQLGDVKDVMMSNIDRVVSALKAAALRLAACRPILTLNRPT
jgi:hypothetical protein